MKKLGFLPHLMAVVIMFAISAAYFPLVFQGKQLSQHDKMTWQGMAKEIEDFRKEHKEEPLWTNAMFGGMPAYLITVKYKQNLLRTPYQLYNLGSSIRPVSFLFVLLMGFYITLLVFGLKPWLSLAGAIAYAFSSYFLIIIEAGHLTKVLAIAFMPPIIAGVYAAYQGKRLLGAVLVAVFLSFQLMVNHLQITYYTMLVILIFGVAELLNLFTGSHSKTDKQQLSALAGKRLKPFFVSTAVLILAALLAVGSNAPSLMLTYEYGKYSMRGKSDLKAENENKTTGLDKDYATAWSYGVSETLTLLVPNYKGGGSGADYENTKVYKTYVPNIKKYYVEQGVSPKQATTYAEQQISSLFYWGDQPSTSGPVYAGAVVVFLFVLGLFLIKGRLKWWLLSAAVLAAMLSWGRNFMGLTDFFLDHFPGYNKFRTVSMTLVIVEFCLPLLGLLALNNVLENKVSKAEILKALKWSVSITGGFLLLILLFAGGFSYTGPYDSQLGDQLVSLLQDDRKSLLRADAFRSLLLVAASSILVLLYATGKIKKSYCILLFALLFLIDLWPVNKRYLNNKDFVAKKGETPYPKTLADEAILADKELSFRVLNMSVSTFNDASTSYYHQSIGGYHGAKMKRYQELIEAHISVEMQKLSETFNKNSSAASMDEALLRIDSTLATLNVINMLNTKYLIINTGIQPVENVNRLGNVWFVKELSYVENADEELSALYSINPRTTAVVDQHFESVVGKPNLEYDSTATISLLKYLPNNLIYNSKSKKEQVAVFSEIFYDKGWNAYIDGKLVPHARANYVLRTLRIPAGEHQIEFKFEPKAYYTGGKISLASSALIILLCIGGLYVAVVMCRKKVEEPAPETTAPRKPSVK